MQTTAMAHQRNASTYLVHLFGRGLADERYDVQRFETAADGEIRPWRCNQQAKSGRKQARKIMSLRSVQRLRPQRNEIIIATGVRVDGGIQYWGSWACGLFANGRHR